MSGYTIVLTEDIRVQQVEKELPEGWSTRILDAMPQKGPFYHWAEGLGVDFHPLDQASTHEKTHAPIPKWLNPWSIETPRGYSCLFVPPLNNERLPFIPFSGIVDTDTYIPVVNFPFLLADPNFDGTVPAGTPIVQVIPFRRESWEMETFVGTTEAITRARRRLRSKFKNGYRRLFHQPKDFR